MAVFETYADEFMFNYNNCIIAVANEGMAMDVAVITVEYAYGSYSIARSQFSINWYFSHWSNIMVARVAVSTIRMNGHDLLRFTYSHDMESRRSILFELREQIYTLRDNGENAVAARLTDMYRAVANNSNVRYIEVGDYHYSYEDKFISIHPENNDVFGLIR